MFLKKRARSTPSVAFWVMTIGIVLIDIILVLFDVLPDWYYQGWVWQLWSVATGKILALSFCTLYIAVLSVLLTLNYRDKNKQPHK
jgi:hypothetical protein